MPIQKTIKFTEAVSVLDHRGEIVFSADELDIKTLDAASANRWLRRKKAVIATDDDKKPRTRRSGSKSGDSEKDNDSDKD